jgi:hypothetical protein
MPAAHGALAWAPCSDDQARGSPRCGTVRRPHGTQLISSRRNTGTLTKSRVNPKSVAAAKIVARTAMETACIKAIALLDKVS